MKKIASIGIAYGDIDRSVPKIYSLPSSTHDEQILLIEDFLESGRSIRDGRQALHQRAMNVKTASLWVGQQSTYIPDFSLGILENVPQFPWEK